MEENSPATVALVFAGGLGLAAYHAGVYQAFSQKCLPLHWVAGSSAGAATAALIAGNRAEDRIGGVRTAIARIRGRVVDRRSGRVRLLRFVHVGVY